MKKALLASAVFGSLCISSIALAAPTTPTLSLSGGNTPFATVSVAGQGFSPGETVHLMLGLNSTDVTADTGGAFSGAALTIPNFPAGLYLVLALGQTSGVPAFTYLYVNALFPQASPNSWYIAPGSALNWSGSGFVPNETITIGTAASSTLATFTADLNGSFTNAGPSTVPFSFRNSTATYTLTSARSGISNTFHIGVSDLYPYVSPSTWYTTPGSHVTFTGAGFGAGEGVSVFLGASSAGGGASTTPLAHISTDASGAFTAAGGVTIPYLTTSPAAFRLVGDLSGAIANAPVTLAQLYPTLSPSAYYAAPGSHISLLGSGFAPNEIVDITVGAASTTHATTDASGAFTIPSVHLSTTPNTTLTIAATGELSGASTSFIMVIGSYYSWMTLSTYWAQAGATLTLMGHNFAGGETISLTSGSSTLGTATAADDGTFTAGVSVPFAPSGPATIIATGLTSGSTASSVMTIAPTYTDLQLGSYFGKPSEALHFIGHGYLPGEAITVTTDRTGAAVVATFNANATGNFDNSSYLVPANFVEGNLALTVTSAHSFDTKTIVYYVTGK